MPPRIPSPIFTAVTFFCRRCSANSTRSISKAELRVNHYRENPKTPRPKQHKRKAAPPPPPPPKVDISSPPVSSPPERPSVHPETLSIFRTLRPQNRVFTLATSSHAIDRSPASMLAPIAGPTPQYNHLYRVGRVTDASKSVARAVDESTVIVFFGARGVWFTRCSRWNLLFKTGALGEVKWYLEALVKALQICRENEETRNTNLVLATDSAGVVKGMTIQVSKWKKKAWRGDNRQEIPHRSLWEEAERLVEEVEAGGKTVRFWLLSAKQNEVMRMKAVEKVDWNGGKTGS
ncbi:hypothetical protein BZA05DRAFT_408006 [Tricharina praecox]|uniref:uncharacterized protein n=1 Tax=Tricharina praecox TaxID=43433 RepID=UPI0022201E61|nr:uncharacterized protein BZA05DRAFT_408006 [Tricharina praecox]KAI5845536.1 hypothetical protein BZA05DRAFT_408006 [Tricharina praecox]